MAEQKSDSRVPHDPSEAAVARVYATAFLDAVAEGAAEALEEVDSLLSDVLATNPGFADLLTSGATNTEEKLGLIDRVIAPAGSKPVVNLLRTLAAHDRMGVLEIVAYEARLLHEERLGRKRVQVTSAAELSDADVTKIQGSLSQKFPFEPIIETSVDPELIGGLVIQVENTVYDSSLRSRLDQLRDRMRERSLHEIQSGRDRFSHPEGD